jgi:hypothetical protein
MAVASGIRWFASGGRGSPRRCATPTGRAPRRSYRLALDELEDRTTPSTFLVTTPVDPVGRLVRGSLRWAITRANRPANQGSTVAITAGVRGAITLRAGEPTIRSSMTIENASGGPVTIRPGSRASRIFEVVDNARTTAVTINGRGPASPITITGGRVRNGNGGGILVDNPQDVLTLAYTDVVGNSAAQVKDPRLGAKGNGGGVYSSGSVTLEDSTVSGNTASGPNSASGHAGGVYTDRGITLVASHVDANTARNSAGILNVFGSVDVLGGSTVDGNSCSGNSLPTGNLGGGGISEMNGNVIVSDSQVADNHSAGMYSGGIVSLIGGVAITDGSQVDGNTNVGPGGGIAANFGGAVVVSQGSQVDGNTGAGLGGGIVNFSETYGITVEGNSKVSGNTLTNAEDSGTTAGLIDVYSVSKIRRAFIGGGRGDVMLASALQLFVNAIGQRVPLIAQADAALPDGGMTEVGGGVSTALGGPIVIQGNSLISDNHFADVTSARPAIGTGGGVFANLGSITIDGSTISGNVASGDGGGIWNGGSLSIRRGTVTLNQAGGQGGGIFNRGTYTSSGARVVNNTPDDVGS